MSKLVDSFLRAESTPWKLNLYYAAADIISLIPSEEDNFPNVVLESRSGGTPVIRTMPGGMKII